MRKFKKVYWIVLYIGFAVVFASLSASLLAAQKECMEETPGCRETGVQEKKAKQEKIFRSKFENLPAKYQEQARQLGYKEGDMVEMRRDSSGAIVVLPPLKESKTPGQMREKLNSLITGKIAQKMTDDVKVTAMLALDGTGHFTVRLKFEALYKKLQTQAKKLGFRKGNTIAVQVDAVTWEYRILPKEKKAKFSGNVLEIIPPEKPGGSPSYRMTAMYSVLPKDLKKSAKKMGYGKKDAVSFIYREDTKEYKILPPPLVFGISSSFEKLESKKKVKARSLGYKEGDTVWLTIGRTLRDQPIVPKAKAGSGPLFKIEHAKMETDKHTGEYKLIFVCVARFEDLYQTTKQKAREKGHREGDKVRLNYDVKTKKFEITSSGVRKRPVRTPAAVKKTKAKMDADDYFDRGNSYYKKVLYDEAISDYTMAIEINPKNAKAYLYRAGAYINKGQRDKAFSDCTKAIEIDPKYAGAYATRGMLYSGKRLYGKAVSDYTKAIELEPKNTSAYISRGRIYKDKGLYDKAISDYTKWIELDPKSTNAYIERARIYKRKGLYDKAISDYTKAIEIYPRNTTAYISRGSIYEDKGLYDKAISDYTKAIELLPKRAKNYIRRGLVYDHKGLYDKAISDFNKTIEIDPKDALAFYYKALSCEKAGRINEALEAYKTFIQNARYRYASYIKKAKKKIEELEKRSSTTAIKSSGVRKKPVRTRVSLGSVAGNLSENEVGEMLKRKNFFSKQYDWNKDFCNPRGDFANEYEVKVISGDKVVLDHATGLMWHQSGSEGYMVYEKAKKWVDELNRRGYGGYSDWKLPTLEEGASLIERSKMNGDLHIDPEFSARQKYIWTSDAISGYSKRVWVVYFLLGYVKAVSVGTSYYVRPVRSGLKALAAIKSSGVRKKPAKAPAVVKKTKAEIDADVYIKQGSSYRRKGLYDEAISNYTKAIEISPKYAKVYLYRGVAYGHKDLYDKAISDYTKAIEIDPKYTLAYRNRANSYLKEHLYDQAISDYTKAIKLKPKTFDVSLYINRGDAYDHKGLYDKAISDYTKVIKILPNYYSAYVNRGLAYDHKGLYDEAISDYTKVIEVNPKHYALAFYYKALSCEKAGRINEAIEAYKAFIQNAPSNKHASLIEKAKKKIKELEK